MKKTVILAAKIIEYELHIFDDSKYGWIFE